MRRCRADTYIYIIFLPLPQRLREVADGGIVVFAVVAEAVRPADFVAVVQTKLERVERDVVADTHGGKLGKGESVRVRVFDATLEWFGEGSKREGGRGG